MLRLFISATVLGILTLSTAAAQDCTRPPAPTVPDGATASRDRMIAGSQAVQEYMAATESYLGCLKVEESLIPPEELTAEVRQSTIERHNAAVDDMNRVAEAFNQAVRAYKARVQGNGSDQSSQSAAPAEGRPDPTSDQ